MEPIFDAVLKGETEVRRLLADDPASARERAARDVLIESIPHWIYVGDTGLHLAAAGHAIEVVHHLLRAGGDPNARNRRRATPLHHASDARPGSVDVWSSVAQAEVIRALVAAGADVNAGDHGGATPLHRAVRGRGVTAVRELLALGARTDPVLKKRRSTPLHLAALSTGASGTAGAQREQLEIIGLLLRHGAAVGARDADGRTPVDWAKSATIAQAMLRGR